jgi:hypothetical protein
MNWVQKVCVPVSKTIVSLIPQPKWFQLFQLTKCNHGNQSLVKETLISDQNPNYRTVSLSLTLDQKDTVNISSQTCSRYHSESFQEEDVDTQNICRRNTIAPIFSNWQMLVDIQFFRDNKERSSPLDLIQWQIEFGFNSPPLHKVKKIHLGHRSSEYISCNKKACTEERNSETVREKPTPWEE